MIGSRPGLPSVAAEQTSYESPYQFPEEEGASAGFTLQQIWQMVRAHLLLSVAIFVVAVVLAYVAIKNLPKTYNATAALIVHSDDTDPLAGRNFPIGQANSFFPTQVELINNNVMLQPVVDRLNLQKDDYFTRGFVGDPKALNDIVVSNLRSALDVQPGAGSQLLYISAMAPDPEKAADIANAVAEEYLRQSNERTNAPAVARVGRYSDQLAQLKQKNDEAQAAVVEFRQKYGMAQLGQGGNQSDGLEEVALADLQQQLLLAQNARRQLEGRDLDSRADGMLVQQTPEEAALRGKLDELEGDLLKARATMGARHPKIQQLEVEIATTRNQIQADATKRLSAARELEAKYQAELVAARKRLLDRRALQDQGAKLVLEQSLAQEAYAQALRGLDEVQFASEGNYQDVTMVSRAEPPVRASKPNKLKLFAAAVAASFALALGGPFAYELLLNRRVRCRDDLERSFRIVTLAEFGRIEPVTAA